MLLQTRPADRRRADARARWRCLRRRRAADAHRAAAALLLLADHLRPERRDVRHALGLLAKLYILNPFAGISTSTARRSSPTSWSGWTPSAVRGGHLGRLLVVGDLRLPPARGHRPQGDLSGAGDRGRRASASTSSATGAGTSGCATCSPATPPPVAASAAQPGKRASDKARQFWALRDVSLHGAAGRGGRARRRQRPGQVAHCSSWSPACCCPDEGSVAVTAGWRRSSRSPAASSATSRCATTSG